MGDGEGANPFERTRAQKLQEAAECFEKGAVARQKGRSESAKAWEAAGKAWQEEAGDSDGE